MEQLFGRPSLSQMLVALSIAVAFVGLAWLFRVLLLRGARRLAQKTSTDLDDAIVSTLEKPVLAAIIIGGVYLSAMSLPLEASLRWYLSKGLAVVLSVLGIYAVLALIDALAKWYRRVVVAKSPGALTGRLLGLFRVTIWLAGGLTAVVVVLDIIGIELTPIVNWVGEHGWRIALIVLLSMAAVLAIGRLLPKVIEAAVARRVGDSEEEIRKRADTLSGVLENVGQVAVLLLAGFMVLSELGIDIAPILAGLGVAGIAIGFGAQSLVKDLIAGLFIIVDNQYHVGDVVRIADTSGLVEDINLRRTVLRDLDGIVHVVPNGEIRVASNFTKEWSRVNLNVSVAYGEDLDHAMAVINRVGKELAEEPEWAPLILKAPQALRVDNLGESGVEIKILGDTKPIRQWDVMGELRKRLKKAFDQEGIEIPFPHTKVYFGNLPPYLGHDRILEK